MSIVKKESRWAVVHGHTKRKNSKRDKSKGTVIKIFNSKNKALAMHRAIILSEKRRKEK